MNGYISLYLYHSSMRPVTAATADTFV